MVGLYYTRHRNSDCRGPHTTLWCHAPATPKLRHSVAVQGPGAAASATLGVDGVPDERVVPSVEAPESLVAATARARSGPPERFAPAPLRASSMRSLRWAGQRVVAARSRRARRGTGAKTLARPPNKLRAPTTAAERLPRRRARGHGSRVRPCAAVRRVRQLQMTAPRDPRGSQRSSRRRERRLGRSLKHVS